MMNSIVQESQAELTLSYNDQRQLKREFKAVQKYLDKFDKRNERDRIDANSTLYPSLANIMQIIFEGSDPNRHQDFDQRIKLLLSHPTIKELENRFGKTRLKGMLHVASVRRLENLDDYAQDLNPKDLTSQKLSRRDIKINTVDGEVCLLKYIEGGKGKLGTNGFFYMDSYDHSKGSGIPSKMIKFGKTNDLNRRQVEQQSDHCAYKLETPDITSTENKFKAYFEELDVVVLEEAVKNRNIELVYFTKHVNKIMKSLILGQQGVKYNLTTTPNHDRVRKQLVDVVFGLVDRGLNIHTIVTPPPGRSFSQRLAVRLLGELVTIVIGMMEVDSFDNATEDDVFNYCRDVIGLNEHDSKAKSKRYSTLVAMIKQNDLFGLSEV